MAIGFDLYDQAFQNLTSGNLTNAAVLTYTLPLGSFAWFFVIFVTLMVTYIKTQNFGITLILGVVMLAVLQTAVGLVGAGVFWAIIAISIAIILFRYTRG